MPLNPFFLQGSTSEQQLVQDIVNEHLTIHGIEVTYIPRKIINRATIMEEVTSSKFDDNFKIEAYVNTYEGYAGQGDIMSKFGVSIEDEVTLTISKERFEDFISPFLEGLPDSEVEVTSRPREGDIIYFPLGKRLFEIKFVEHENPFYQLGKNYVYELKCELFELEDEMGGWDQVSTTTEEIDSVLVDQGYITSLKLISIGSTATLDVSTTTGSGYVRNIILNNDGYDYTKVPTVAITTAPAGGTNATAVAITTSSNGVYSVKEILLTNPGAGYTVAPTVTIVSAGSTVLGIGSTSYGVGAAATANLVTNGSGIGTVSIGNSGSGYPTNPTLIFNSAGVGNTATGRAIINSAGFVTSILISDAGTGYPSGFTGNIGTVTPPPIISGTGTYKFNEIVTGSVSSATGRVKTWDVTTNTLKLGTTNGTFVSGDVAIGSTSDARYSVDYIESAEYADKYDKSDEIETEADSILDFTEKNPFGNV